MPGKAWLHLPTSVNFQGICDLQRFLHRRRIFNPGGADFGQTPVTPRKRPKCAIATELGWLMEKSSENNGNE
eukprot:8683365-Karenia_brevis.AAC.1